MPSTIIYFANGLLHEKESIDNTAPKYKIFFSTHIY